MASPLADILSRQPWQERALCAQVDHDLFFPEKGGATRDAKKICTGCPVREDCLKFALDHDERFGVWGGLSERERRGLRTHEKKHPGRQVDPERDQRILELIQEGLAAPAIAERLQLPGPNTVYTTAHRLNVSMRSRERSPSAQPDTQAITPEPVDDPEPEPEPITAPRPTTRRRWTDAELTAAVQALTAARFTPAEIATQLGISPAAVRRHRAA